MSTVRRPGLVTLVVVLTVISGIGSIFTGFIAINTSGGLLGVGILQIIVGLIYLAVAKGLSDGNRVARLIVAVVSVIQIIVGVFALIGTLMSGARTSAVGSAIVAAVVLAILFSPRANAFFGSR